MITLTGISHRYGSRTALEDVSLRFRPNRISGLLGLNGAGKSTLLGIVTGCLAPWRGTVEIGGVDIAVDRAPLARVGYLPEVPPLYPDLYVGEQLEYAAALKSLARPAEAAARAARMADIAAAGRRLIGTLSKGYRQRVGIAQALLGDPAIIVLDEPTVGLDPGQLESFRSLLVELAHERTVVFSSHILSEVQRLADSVAILAHGRLVADGPLADLARLGRGAGLVATLAGSGLAAAAQTFAALEGVADCEAIEEAPEGTTLRLTGDDTPDLRRRIFETAVGRGWTLLELRAAESGLEEIFAACAAAE